MKYFVDYTTDTYMNIQLWIGIHVIKEFLVVGVLSIPLWRVIISEVISKWSDDYICCKQLRFLPVLVKDHLRSEIVLISYKN